MSSILITFLLFVGAAFQSLLPPVAFLGSLEWPVITGLLVYITFRTDRPRVIYASILSGLLYDSFSPAPLGTSLPFFLLTGLGVLKLREEVFSDQVITYFVLGLLAVLLKTVYFLVVLSVSGLRPLQWTLLPSRLLGGIILGTLTVPAVYFFLSFMQSKLSESRRRI